MLVDAQAGQPAQPEQPAQAGQAEQEHAEFAQEFEFMTGRPWPRNSRLLVQSERQVAVQSAAAPQQ